MNAAVDVSEFRIARKDVRILGTVQAVAVNIEQGDIVEKRSGDIAHICKNIRDISVNANDIRDIADYKFFTICKRIREGIPAFGIRVNGGNPCGFCAVCNIPIAGRAEDGGIGLGFACDGRENSAAHIVYNDAAAGIIDTGKIVQQNIELCCFLLGDTGSEGRLIQCGNYVSGAGEDIGHVGHRVQLVVEQVDNGCGNIIAFVGRGTDERGEQQSKKQDNNQKKKSQFHKQETECDFFCQYGFYLDFIHDSYASGTLWGPGRCTFGISG